MRHVLVGLAALALSIPAAGAQTPAQSQFEQAALLLYGPCNRADVNADAAGAITACDAYITNMLQVKTKIPPETPHDLNVDNITRGSAEIRVARAYSVQDGGISSRVCAKMEMSWISLAATDPTASPSLAGTLKTLIDGQVETLKKCRAAFGTPDSAPPLPPG